MGLLGACANGASNRERGGNLLAHHRSDTRGPLRPRRPQLLQPNHQVPVPTPRPTSEQDYRRLGESRETGPQQRGMGGPARQALPKAGRVQTVKEEPSAYKKANLIASLLGALLLGILLLGLTSCGTPQPPGEDLWIILKHVQ